MKLRFTVDIEVDKEPTEEELDRATDLFKSFAHGVVPMVATSEKDTAEDKVPVHEHVSSRLEACNYCINLANDGKS